MKFQSLALLLTLTAPVVAQSTFTPNYDESKVPAYTLPDVLKSSSGKQITTASQWTATQRPAILALYKEHVYGQMPGKAPIMRPVVRSVDENALGGKAIRKQITIFFGNSDESPGMEVLLYLPKTNKLAPVFVGLNFYGNHCVSTDPGITLSTRWLPNTKSGEVVNNRATEKARGMQATRWQVDEVIARGYGVATVYYGDLEPDHVNGWKTGIRSTLKNDLKIAETDWSAIGAWAWGLSRLMDYLETDSSVDVKRVILHGHSRLGKAALWAGANDERFAMVISNDSGEGGAAIARRMFGETIERINTSFPYWFVGKFKTYNNNENALPVDQHMLLALVAPRPLYVASAEEDQWADPKGEFLGAKAAEPVWTLFGKKGLGVSEMPPVNKPVGQTVNYHIRTGGHNITPYDWVQYLNAADRLLPK